VTTTTASGAAGHASIIWHGACDSSNCLEVRPAGRWVEIRTTGDGLSLTCTVAEWEQFRDAIKAGAFDTLER
jgi:hypothetical protein